MADAEHPEHDAKEIAAAVVREMRQFLLPLPFNAPAVQVVAGTNLLELILNPPTGQPSKLAEIAKPEDVAVLVAKIVHAARIAFGEKVQRAAAMHAFAVAFLDWPVTTPYPLPERPV